MSSSSDAAAPEPSAAGTPPVEPASVAATFDPADPSVVTTAAPHAPKHGVALCLSGGGSRAMLYHAGSILRLAEVGELAKLRCISSVSGGSITAGALASVWARHGGAPSSAIVRDEVIGPLLELSSKFVDIPAFIVGSLLPGSSPGREFAKALDQHLLHGLKLGTLPDTPEFVFNATNLGTGVLWRFSKAFVGDYQVGGGARPALRVADAVAASSAFPPFFAPFTIRFRATDRWESGALPVARAAAFRRTANLGDGGIYDNLGLETAWKRFARVYVSDGGGTYKLDPRPHGDFFRLTIRVTETIDHQVRSLRLRQVVEGYKRGKRGESGGRTGALWAIRTPYEDYPDRSPRITAPAGHTEELSRVGTHMRGLESVIAHRLVNWGYAITDAALRSYVQDVTLDEPSLPFPDDGI
jgi:NTE family protein